jgi:Domain of unknown function (DUF1963)
MDEGTIDRRGLFRHLFSQAARAAVPGLGAAADVAGEPPTRALMSERTLSIDELLACAEDVGLHDRHAALSALARRSVRLAPAVTKGSGGVGFGGGTRLPRGVAWPQWQGRQLTFLAQIDLDPALGRLLFFFDTATHPSGLEAAHAGAGCVLRIGDERLVRARGPSSPLTQCPGEAAPELVIPRAWSAVVERLELSEDERAAWEVLRERLATAQGVELTDRVVSRFHVVHRFLGYADETVGDMPLICELCGDGRDATGGPPLLRADAHELERGAARWELLAQFSGDDRLGWPWGSRRIHFWIDRDALALGDMRRVWTIAR